ncbi:hypothetical protein KFK09_023912 [Dendrobium nobile]|uniref:Erythronate-4-phosphate dehydrogenase family protein n=1 Tax=Dendrobium nobile TaxID=94219 RepID=A0A8T3ABJ2_DENNO|nr:hypothetical protein KFK09_023912 [Dendrobium nobile]
MDTRAAPQEKVKSLRTDYRLHAGSAATPSPSSWLEIRLFYVRIFPCAAEAVPPNLILSHLRRDIGVALEINGSRIPSCEPTFLALRRDRLDSSAGEVTYLSTDGVRLTGSVEFEVCDGDGNLILCGSLENMEAQGIIRTISFEGHSESCYDPKARWSMKCFSAASFASSAFVQPKFGISSPSIEVYVAGCFAGSPSILTQTIQLGQIKNVARTGALDAIPEDKEANCNPVRCREVFSFNRSSLSDKDDSDEYPETNAVGHSYYPEDLYSEEDGQLSWFNAGVRVGVGIGLGMCIGIGIGAGLLMRSYQATTRGFRRRFF